MPSQKSLSRMISKSIESKKSDSSKSVSNGETGGSDGEAFAIKYSFPNDLMENIFKEFEIEGYLVSIMEEYEKRKFLTDTSHIIGFYRIGDLEKRPVLGETDIGEKFTLPTIPKTIEIDGKTYKWEWNPKSFEKYETLEVLGKAGAGLYFITKNNTVYSLEFLGRILNSIFKTYPNIKSKEVEFLTFYRPNLPLIIRVKNKYEFYIAPKIAEEEDEFTPEEIRKMKGRAVSLEKLLWFASLPSFAMRRAKELRKASSIYDIKEEYRDIKKSIKKLIKLMPKTIQGITKVSTDVKEVIDEKIKHLLGQINETINKKLKRIRTYYGRFSDPLSEIEGIYKDVLKKSKTLKGVRGEILISTGKAIEDAKILHEHINNKLEQIKSKLVDTLEVKEIKEELTFLRETYGRQREFVKKVKELIPNVDYEHLEESHFYLQDKDVDKFIEVVNTLYNEYQ